ncbi:PA2778 family cysteine peptidase [Methylotenera mobilis]|uniref:Tetratricopeptide TPR_4 n=1 Tax=Methylotenera mobilis (strain JLW8 / ATCC BAA-1282 / DSM 17540) TaxID=583345 RepID=C6WX77_METML|nr:PA2778 family cysteine peptidase [Methylotenera mobilis]ACT48526.1 Tetratricopeptide TPR_4 [Methylotenera mobilis JLW8]
MLHKWIVLAFCLLLNACAATGVRETVQNTSLPRQHELTQTPFFPQSLYHCGPAALATALNAVEIRVTQEQLVPEVYIPARQGSLQIEMLAAARRHGALAIKVAPKLDAVLAEVASGNVVVVMQNLGLSWVPSWHYAVVVGYNLDRELVWLRSGTYERFEMSLSAFQRTWARSNYWAFVALKPGNLPKADDPDAVAKAIVAFENNASKTDIYLAYDAAATRWPKHLVLLMGLGNSAYALGQYADAVRAFRSATIAHPNSAAAYNNLANVLLLQGDAVAAKDAAEKALQLTQADPALRVEVSKTVDEVNAYIKKSPH